MGLWSSETGEWSTPSEFYVGLDREFHFELDVAASPTNAKCARYFTVEDDGLSQPWAPAVCWMNPPYGRSIAAWVAKAWHESTLGAVVVGLIPARTDTAWWHDYVAKATEVRFVRGRLGFGGVDAEPGSRQSRRLSAPFPSAVAIWRTKSSDPTTLRAVSTEAGDRLLARNADRSPEVVEWLTNDIRAIEQEEFDRTVESLSEPAPKGVSR